VAVSCEQGTAGDLDACEGCCDGSRKRLSLLRLRSRVSYERGSPAQNVSLSPSAPAISNLGLDNSGKGLGIRGKGSGFEVQSWGFMVEGLGFGV